MERLEEYMERKRLEVNTEKNDHEVQEGGGGRMARKVWRWKGRELGSEGVQVFGVCNTKERGAEGAGEG